MADYTTNFILRTDKKNLKGQSPILLTISVSNQLKKLSTGISVLPELWDNDKKRVIYLDLKTAKKILPNYDYDLLPLKNDVKRLNESLQGIKREIEKIADRFELEGIEYSSEMLVDTYKGSAKQTTKKEAPKDYIFDFLDKYIQDNEPNRAKGSLQVYKSLKKHLQNYQNDKRTKVRFDKMDTSFMRSFQNYLIQWNETNPNTKRVNTLNNVTIAKQLSSIKTVLTYAKREGVEVKGNYKDFSIKKQKLEVIALTERELMRLINLDLSQNERLDRVRDLFVFSAVTGLRYSDLKQLKHEHVSNGEIQITVTKTKEGLIIPLNKYSLAILNKYKDCKTPLPAISNQRLNEYLKELCKIAEINDSIEIVRYKGAERITTVHPKYELISIHNGRKTFATLSLEKGMNAETVMKLGGWSDYKSFSRYVNITENVKRTAMSTAWGAPEVMKVINGGAE
ncbi:MAG TPA: site-specific integrase [Pedobacter sp.]|nr:site-specific integrase [Pedobacter sp.]